MLRYLQLSVLAIVLISGCQNSTTDSNDSGGDGEMIGLAVRAVNTGTGDLELETDSNANIQFCYEEEGCVNITGGSFHTIFEGEDANIDFSTPDKHAVGVKVSFRVTNGSGKAEVISGRPYRDNSGFLEFEDGEVLHTSSSFSKGDVVTFEYGDTSN
jgi:hypothetical protein